MQMDLAGFVVALLTLFVSGAVAYYVKVAASTDKEIKDELRAFSVDFKAHCQQDAASFQRMHEQIDKHVSEAHARISKVDVRIARLEERGRI